jgi:hypothetical protein
MNFLYSMLQNISAAIILPLVSVGGFFTQANTLIIIPPQPAIISILPAELAEKPQSPIPASSTQETKLSDNTGAVETQTSTVAAVAANESIEPKPVQPADVSQSSVATTAKKFLDKTTLAQNQRFDGSYWLSLRTNLSGSNFNWTLSKNVVNGFSVSYSCDPAPDLSEIDGEPSFQIRTSYSCDVSLAGKNKVAETKKFGFETGPGRLVISVASGMQSLLRDDKNESGFVFNNQDDFPVAITGFTFDISFTALSTSTPVAVRFANPVKETSLADYNIQNVPADISRPYSSADTNIKVSFSDGFMIKEHDQKMISVQAMGVRKTPFLGVDPEIKITLRDIGTDRSDVKKLISSAIISWKCAAVNLNQPAGLPTTGQCSQ